MGRTTHLPGLSAGRALCGLAVQSFDDPPSCRNCIKTRSNDRERIARRGITAAECETRRLARLLPRAARVSNLPAPRRVSNTPAMLEGQARWVLLHRLGSAIAHAARRLARLSVPFFDGRCEAIKSGGWGCERCNRPAVRDHPLGYAVCPRHSLGRAGTKASRRRRAVWTFDPEAVAFRAALRQNPLKLYPPDF